MHDKIIAKKERSSMFKFIIFIISFIFVRKLLIKIYTKNIKKRLEN